MTRFQSKMKLKATLCLYIHLQIARWGGDLMKVKYVSPRGTGFFFLLFLFLTILYLNKYSFKLHSTVCFKSNWYCNGDARNARQAGTSVIYCSLGSD